MAQNVKFYFNISYTWEQLFFGQLVSALKTLTNHEGEITVDKGELLELSFRQAARGTPRGSRTSRLGGLGIADSLWPRDVDSLDDHEAP